MQHVEANRLVPDDEVAKTTNAAAGRSVQLLQLYFVEQSVSNAYHAAIDVWADEVFRRANAKMNLYTCTTCVNLIVLTCAWHWVAHNNQIFAHIN